MKTLRLRLLMALCFVLAFSFVHSQTHTARNISITPNSQGYYEYLPQGYTSSQTYPLIIFIHGLGELGTNLSLIPRNGIPNLISQGAFPTSFTVNGQTHRFIVISPQFVAWPSAGDVDKILDYVLQNYSVNRDRVYMTGLSMGGGVTWEYAGGSNTYARRLSAIVPVCGASWPETSRAKIIAKENVAVWATHNSGDPTVPVYYTNDYVTHLNNAGINPPAKKTIWQSSSHNAWSTTYDPNFRENGLNVYEWMLQYHRGGGSPPPPPPPPANVLPVSNAGANQIITLPANTITLYGNGTDADGSIVRYQWTLISGTPTFTSSDAYNKNLTLSNLSAGTYVLRLTVTDNAGASASDDVQLTVARASNLAPTASAGPDKTITPGSSVTLYGSGSDPDGSITSYTWSLISGSPSFTYSSPFSNQITLTNLAAGTYELRLTVTDNAGATATDNVQLVVTAGASPPGFLRIEAENYIASNGVQLIGSKVRYMDLANWAGYHVTTPAAATYTINFRVTSPTGSSQFYVVDGSGTIVLSAVTIPQTSDWNNWITVSTTVSLPAGSQILYLYSISDTWDIDWFELTNGQGQSVQTAKPPIEILSEDLIKASQLAIHPNPIKDQFVLQLINTHTGPVKVQIIDIRGAIRKEFQLSKNQVKIQYNLSANGLSAGAYILRIQTGKSIQSKKMLKM